MEEDSATVPAAWRYGFPALWNATPEEVYFFLSRGVLPADYDNQAVLDAHFTCDLDSNGELLTLSDASVVDADGTTR